MSRKFRIGLAGIGPHMMEHLLPALRLIPGAEVVAAVSSSPRKQQELGRALWIPIWRSDIDTLIATGTCDGIVVSGSVDYHERVLAACINHRLPVFVEKPPVANLTALDRLARTAEATQTAVGVGLNLPHTEAIQRMDQYLEKNRFNLMNIQIRYHTNKPRTSLWNLNSLLESFLLGIFIHPLSVVHHYLGPAMHLTHAQVEIRGEHIDLRLALEGHGHQAEISGSNHAPSHVCDFDFHFENGIQLQAMGLGSLIKVEDGRHFPIWCPGPLVLSLNSNGFLRELQQFVERASHHEWSDELGKLRPIYILFNDIIRISKTLRRSPDVAIQQPC